MNTYQHPIYLTFLLLFGFSIIAEAQTRTQIQKSVENVIYHDAKVQFKDTPGFIIGLIAGDSTYVFSYGSQSKTVDIPITDSTLFELGGASKIFTASLIELLVQQGELDYDMPLDKYLPKGNQKQTEVLPSIFDLVSHQSGLPRVPVDFGVKEVQVGNPYAHFSKQDLGHFYNNHTFEKSPQAYSYSNLGYALLETAIEHTTKQSFETTLQNTLLLPYQLQDTRIQLGNQQAQLSPGYSIIGKKVGPWDCPSFSGATGIKSSMRDLLDFVQLQLSDDNFSSMHQKITPTLVDRNSYTAKGWHVITLKKYYDMIVHTGSTAGHQTFIGLVKETNTGVVILSNSKLGTNGLGYFLVKLLNNNFKKSNQQKQEDKLTLSRK